MIICLETRLQLTPQNYIREKWFIVLFVVNPLPAGKIMSMKVKIMASFEEEKRGINCFYQDRQPQKSRITSFNRSNIKSNH